MEFTQSVFIILFMQLTMVLNQMNVLPDLTIRNARAEEGRKQYEILLSDTKLPRYGTCWQTALDNLHSSCNKLTEETQSRMSLAFINCFLKQSGKRTFPCPADRDIASCLSKMDDLSFQIYANYLPHTQNMCFFILSQVWTEEIGASVSTLMSASSEVRNRLDDSLTKQERILEAQQESLVNEGKMLLVTSDLMSSIQSSKMDVLEMIDEFKDSTAQQKMVVHDVFDRVLKFQSMFFGEFSSFFSVFYHVVSVLLSYVLTTPTRCANARFWLFLVAIANVMSERCLADWGLHDYDPDRTKILMHQRIWLFRTVSWIVAIIIWIVTAVRYKDYNYENYQILESIQKQLQELKNPVMSTSFSMSRILEGSAPSSMTPNKMMQFKTIEAANKLSSDEEDPSFTLSDTDISGYETESNYTTAPQSIEGPSTFPKEIQKPKREVRCRTEREWRASPQSRYNLRQRTPSVNFNATLITETPEMFTKLVQQLEKTTKKHSVKVRKAVFNGRISTLNFSDDETS